MGPINLPGSLEERIFCLLGIEHSFLGRRPGSLHKCYNGVKVGGADRLRLSQDCEQCRLLFRMAMYCVFRKNLGDI